MRGGEVRGSGPPQENGGGQSVLEVEVEVSCESWEEGKRRGEYEEKRRPPKRRRALGSIGAVHC